MSYGIRRRNLLSYFDGKDVCQPMPPLTRTTVEAKGVIPYQYRDSSDILHYIDTVKVTDLNSGNSYTASVQSNDTWTKTISFTFNNNEATILVQGYNYIYRRDTMSPDMQNLLKGEKLLHFISHGSFCQGFKKPEKV